MSLQNDSNSENDLYLLQELNDENIIIYNGVNLNDNYENENIFDNYLGSIPENNQFYHLYNEVLPHQNNDEEEENFDNTPENTINLDNNIKEVDFKHQKEKKEEVPIEFNNIPENNEEFDSINEKTVYLKTINNNKENKKKKEKKGKKEKKQEKEKTKEYKKKEKVLGKKRGRKSSNEQYHDNSKEHSREELGNATRKMLTSCIDCAHSFIKLNTKHDFMKPTITAVWEENKEKKPVKLINSHEKLRKLVNQTLYTFYHDYTFPKKFNFGDGFNYIKDLKLRKIKMLEAYKEWLESIKEEEKNKKIKKLTALLDLKFIQFLDVYLDYGYESYDNKKIEIDEKKYGFKSIDLKDFVAYKQIRYEFSGDETKQNYYRTHLKKIIHGN